MSFKTVLVHVDDTRRSPERVRLAAQIAGACGGHLIGAALTGVSRLSYGGPPQHPIDAHLALHLDYLRERAGRTLASFGGQLGAHGVATFEARVIDDETAGGLSQHARCADLVVIGQVNLDEASPFAMADVPGYVVMHAARPVLIVPYAGLVERVGQRIVIAWDASKEAARAVSLALPLLQLADTVEVAVLGSDASVTPSAQAGEQLLRFLLRHGVRANLSAPRDGAAAGARRQHLVGEALLALAGEIAADLLVMGAYGHSRFRETVLGGVTRTVLENMTIPVLMSH